MSRGKNVKQLILNELEKSNMSKKLLGREMGGILPQQLNNIFNRDVNMPLKYFVPLCQILGIEREELKQAYIQDYSDDLENKIKEFDINSISTGVSDEQKNN